MPDEVLDRIANLFANCRWIFAKTMPENPHEYTLRKEWNDADFVWAVETIRKYGRVQYYQRRKYIVLDVGEHFHWTMGAPIDITILINRKPLLAEP